MKQNQKKTHVIIIIYNYSFIIFIVRELEIKKINDIISKNIDRIRNASVEEAIKKLKPFTIKQKLKEIDDIKRREINNYYFKKINKLNPKIILMMSNSCPWNLHQR